MEQPKKKRRVNESPVAQRINKYLRKIQESIHRMISIKGNENMYLETLEHLTAAVNLYKEGNMDYALTVARFKAWQWNIHVNVARLLQAKQKYDQKYDNPSNFEKRATLLKFLQDLQLNMHKLEGTNGLMVAMQQWKSHRRSLGKKMLELKAAALAEGKAMKEEEADEIRDESLDNIDLELLRQNFGAGQGAGQGDVDEIRDESLVNIDFGSLWQNFDASGGQGAGQGDVDEIDVESLDNIDVESIRRRLMTEATTEAAEERREDLLSRAIWKAIYELYPP